MRGFNIVIGSILCFIATECVTAYLPVPANADEEHHCCRRIEWSKLNLSPEQSQQIQQLEAQWAHDYNQIKPLMTQQQQKLTQLLSAHNSDPVEIMALQQSLTRQKSELNALATANYLKKRQILNENQQCMLECMIRRAVAERQKELNANAQTEAMPDRIQNLLQRVRSVLPAQSER